MYKISSSISSTRFIIEERLQKKLSPIHGYGIFALVTFGINEEVFSTDHYSTNHASFLGSVKVGPFEHLLEPIVIRWVNHSCDSNAFIKFENDNLKLLTKREINIGEEITCNYKETEDLIPYPFYCNCGHCDRKLIE